MVDGTGAFRNGAASGSVYADFDQNYNVYNNDSQGDTRSGHVVQGGETLSSIAAALWGDKCPVRDSIAVTYLTAGAAIKAAISLSFYAKLRQT